uniref:Uncharacterized protein n=2 Tax=Leptocylindrus danicus TaxID=163516 RepID=A0A7S2JXX4_9STRA|mmetsp:Transcript_14034/g.20780  ORF Transcript_14034/g.20780 Transcript_14034/m.20780 type:complete len:214 (+) Transcript_14034:201-842(+)
MEMVELAPMTTINRPAGRISQHKSSSSSCYRTRCKAATDMAASNNIVCRSNNASVHATHEEDCDCSTRLYLEDQEEVIIRADPHDDACIELLPIRVHDMHHHHQLNPKQQRSSSSNERQIISNGWDSTHQDAFMNIIIEEHANMQTRTFTESRWADTGAFGLSKEIDCIKHEIDEIENRIEEIESNYMEDILTNRVPSLARTRICNTWRPHVD